MVKDSSPAGGPVAWAPVSDVEREAARRRRGLATLWLATVAGVVVGVAVGWTLDRLLWGLALGLVAGGVVGVAALFVLWLWPMLRLLWHWALEIAAGSALVAAAAGIAHLSGSWWWALLLLAPLAAGAVFGPVRRWVLAWVGCVVTRHRLRVCFAGVVRVHNRLDPGLVPLILVSRPTPAGERVWLWLRPGLDVVDLETRAGKIAVACWASEVQVTRSRRFAALVRLDVTRRDPLTGLVRSPLLAGVPLQRSGPVVDETDALKGLVLDLDDTPRTVGGAR